MNSRTHENQLLAYLALAAVCIIWGTTYLALRIGVTQFPPFLFSLIRFSVAGPLLVLFMLTLGKQTWPDRKTLFNQAVSGVLMTTLGTSMVGWGEVYISSGLAAVICSVMPVWTILINVIVLKDEKPNWIILSGLAIGLTGIIMIFSEHLNEFTNPLYIFGIVITFAGNISWALGSVWIKKKNQNTDPFLGAGLQMSFGAVALIPLSLAFDNYVAIRWTAEVGYALLYIIVIGSMAAYVCYSYAIKKLPMTVVSLYAYINPIVAVVLGWLILEEKLNLQIGIAILITIAGIYIVNRGYHLKSSGPTWLMTVVKGLKFSR
ncbi:MAG: EamA family transporter [Cyclobacteriaceae bacterium]|nr:EamA family transporter [Cyclobacteriaceae bacterium]